MNLPSESPAKAEAPSRTCGRTGTPMRAELPPIPWRSTSRQKRLGLDQAPVDPQLTFAAQFRTPSTVTVDFGSQFCQGERLAGQRR